MSDVVTGLHDDDLETVWLRRGQATADADTPLGTDADESDADADESDADSTDAVDGDSTDVTDGDTADTTDS